MMPNLHPESIVFIEKLSLGPRIIDLIKLKRDGIVQYLRLPGLCGIRNGDILIFDAFYQDRFPLNTNETNNRNLVKRCYAIPGDTLNINFLLRKSTQNIINKDTVNDISLFSLMNIGKSRSILTEPLITPRAGLAIKLTSNNLSLYSHVIQYENPDFELQSNCLNIGNRAIYYTFKFNYYFLIGDNINNSLDSRHFGFVPESSIIGRVITKK